jgi:hypothetical protein
VLGVGVEVREERCDLLVRGVADRAQERRDRQLALAVDLHRDDVLVRRLELEPRAAVRDELPVEEAAACRRVVDRREVDPRRAHELRDHDALGAVDHEGALVGHPREVAEENVLFADLSGLFVHELDASPQGLGEREVLRPALLLGVLRLPELARDELQIEVLPGEVLNRGNLGEQLAKPFLTEPLKGVDLRLDQVRERQNLGQRGEVTTGANGCGHPVEGDGHGRTLLRADGWAGG